MLNNDSLIGFIYDVVDGWKNTKTSDLVNILRSEDSAWSHVEKNTEINDELIQEI